jgi:hypothetical protein
VVCALHLWWLWPAENSASAEGPTPELTSANEGAIPEVLKQSSWNAPLRGRLAFRRTGQSMEAAFQPIEVKESGNAPWSMTPQWQPVSEADFGR